MGCRELARALRAITGGGDDPGRAPLGEVRDFAGRQGVGVEIHAGHGTRRVLIFDPETLGYREGPGILSVGRNDREAGPAWSETAYLEEGVVDEIGQRP